MGEPIFGLLRNGKQADAAERLALLLAQPSLNLTVEYEGLTPEQYARSVDCPALADAIHHEVERRAALIPAAPPPPPPSAG